MSDETAPDPILDELRSIRALLEAMRDDEMRCPHGGTGVCMYCLIPIVEHALREGFKTT